MGLVTPIPSLGSATKVVDWPVVASVVVVVHVEQTPLAAEQLLPEVIPLMVSPTLTLTKVL
jgi:hypothetical protein